MDAMVNVAPLGSIVTFQNILANSIIPSTTFPVFF